MEEEIRQLPYGTEEVPMVEPEVVEEVLVLHRLGRSIKSIAKELELSRNTVRRYVRGKEPGVQKRPDGLRLSVAEQAHAEELWRTTAEGNGKVVQQLLREEGIVVSLRTLQRYLRDVRMESKARALATMRFETRPGEQLQIDFGERWVRIGGVAQKVYFFVATLGYSRRMYVRAGLSERLDEWKLGLEGAFEHFGGLPQYLVVDNAKSLILEHTEGQVRVHPGFAAYCKDRGVGVVACRPYRARTKGKVESGVKYVKRNAIAGRSFESFAALERHLAAWTVEADRREHGTTHERPMDRFDAAERQALRPLHRAGLQVTSQRLVRQVANDCHVDVDTVRYSVPARLVRCTVEVEQTATQVRIWYRQHEVACHRRGTVRHQWVTDPSHVEGLVRSSWAAQMPEGALDGYGRTLSDYSQYVGGDA